MKLLSLVLTILVISVQSYASSCHKRVQCPEGSNFEYAYADLGDGVLGTNNSGQCRGYTGSTQDGSTVAYCECKSELDQNVVHLMSSCLTGPRVYTTNSWELPWWQVVVF